jgi:hypothetical protein
LADEGREASQGREADPRPESGPGRPLRRPGLPILISLVCLAAGFLLTVARLLGVTGGHFAYVLDDPYIHMAMAKNLAQHGTWGLHSGQFANTSSSPLWTLLLAVLDRALGVRDITPLLLNVLCAGMLLVVAGHALLAARPRDGAWGDGWILGPLLALLFWTPLIPLVFTGQEHLLHTLGSVLFLLALFRVLWPASSVREVHSRLPEPLYLIAALLPLIRYEGLFLCAAGALLLWGVGRRRQGAAVLLAACLPVGLFGLFCLLHGWFPFPNPILLKANLPHSGSKQSLLDFARCGYRQAVAAPHLLFLLLAALGLLLARWPARGRPLDRWTAGLGVFAVTTLFHLQFARLRWFFRYEAYLVFLGIFLIAGASIHAWRDGWLRREPRLRLLALAILAFFPAAALSDRALDAATQVPQAARNVWEQQVQMGLFLQRFYPGAPVAANDLGAISYLSDVDGLDLWGLASMEVARSRLAGDYDAERIAQFARDRGTKIAVLYDAWFKPGAFGGIAHGRKGGLPADWVRVGQWTIQDNLVGGDATVSFYAVQPAEQDSLMARLRAFARSLPPRVRQAGPYREGILLPASPTPGDPERR